MTYPWLWIRAGTPEDFVETVEPIITDLETRITRAENAMRGG